MMTTEGLRCPGCERLLESHAWHDAGSGQCRRCGTAFEFVAFPSLTSKPAAVAAQPSVVAEDSVCFFHAENRAEAVCDECGRLVCAVCAVPFMGRTLCPTCIAVAAKKPEQQIVAVRDRVLWDSIALSIAAVPVLLVFTIMLTLVTAPVALGFAVYAWNKPGSLIYGRRRWRLILAVVLALAEIGWWIFVFTARLGSHR